MGFCLCNEADDHLTSAPADHLTGYDWILNMLVCEAVHTPKREGAAPRATRAGGLGCRGLGRSRTLSVSKEWKHESRQGKQG